MNSIVGLTNVFSIAVLSGTLSMPASGQDVEVQAGGTNVGVAAGGVDVEVAGSDNRDVSTARRTGADVGDTLNSQIASWAATDQASIVNLAKFGLGHTQTPAVKQLATTIVREHQQLAAQLAKVAPIEDATSSDANQQLRRETRARREAAEQTREATTEARRDAVRNSDGVRTSLENFGDRIENRVERLADRAEQAAGATRDAIDRSIVSEDELSDYRLSQSPWLEIHREIIAELDQSAQDELGQYQGYEFDASFVGMLIAAHLQQESTLKVLSQHASGELAVTLQTSLGKIRQHREQAEKVMDAIKPTR